MHVYVKSIQRIDSFKTFQRHVSEGIMYDYIRGSWNEIVGRSSIKSTAYTIYDCVTLTFTHLRNVSRNRHQYMIYRIHREGVKEQCQQFIGKKIPIR